MLREFPSGAEISSNFEKGIAPVLQESSENSTSDTGHRGGGGGGRRSFGDPAKVRNLYSVLYEEEEENYEEEEEENNQRINESDRERERERERNYWGMVRKELSD